MALENSASEGGGGGGDRGGMSAAGLGAAGGAGAALGGVLGYALSGGERRAARDKFSEAMGEIMSLGLPPDLSAPLVLEKYRQAGELTPELEQAIQAGVSQMAGVKADQDAVSAQKSALQLISQRGKLGLTPEDRLQLAQIQQSAAKDAESKRQQILQNFASRGQGGSGSELASAMMASQDAAQRGNDASMQAGAAASKNALEAIANQGNLGSTIRNASFNEGSQIANAEDARKQFDIQNMRDVQTRNVGSKNQSQQYNLTNAQNISNANTTQQNNEAKREAEAKRQYWQDQMDRAKLRSGALMGQADMNSKEAAGKAGMWSGIGQAVGTGAGAMMMSDKKTKTNISENSAEFLDDIKPYQYEYKDDKHGEGKQVGVMAQDVEKSLPQMIVDTDEGKAIDFNKAGGPIFAALASINARVKKLER